ncbi:MAG: methytransferase partner Trm112 [Methanomicrobiales archaeon]|nr:methytransferase partner Trm112 [Methanomicrobiales archaeon]
MKRSLLDILCCPACMGDLALRTTDEGPGEILEGTLFCGRCQVDYPISDGIPDLIPREPAGR